MNMDKLVGEVFTRRENDVLFLVVGNDQEDEYNLVILNDFSNEVKELDLNFLRVITKEELLLSYVHVPYVKFTGTLKLEFENKGDI